MPYPKGKEMHISLELEGKYIVKMVGRIGIEPMTQRLKAFCSTD